VEAHQRVCDTDKVANDVELQTTDSDVANRVQTPTATSGPAVNIKPSQYVVAIACTKKWEDKATLTKESMDIRVYDEEDSEGSFLDATVADVVIESIVSHAASLWIPPTVTYTSRHRPDNKPAKVVSRDLVEMRKAEDAQLGPFIKGFKAALDRGAPVVMIGTQETDRPGIADTAAMTNLVKQYAEVKVLRVGGSIIIASGVELPGSAVLKAIEENVAGAETRLVKWFVVALRKSVVQRRKVPAGASALKRSGHWGHTLAVAAKRQLYGRRAGVLFEGRDNSKLEVDPDECRQYIGGLRRAGKSVSSVPSLIIAGHKLSVNLDQFLDADDSIIPFVMQLIDEGTKVEHDADSKSRCSAMCRKCKLEEVTDGVRKVMAETTGATDTQPVVDRGGVSTALRPGLIGAWQRFAQDPDDQIEQWLTFGGPCGLELFPRNAGVFEPVDDTAEDVNPEEILAVDVEIVATKIDADADAFAQLTSYEEKGYVRSFASVKEAQAFVGGSLVLSDLVVVEKTKPDGTKKRRIILNCKSSGVSRVSKKTERVRLPRVMDVVFDTMEICCGSAAEQGTDEAEFYVVDVEEAYWNVPVAPQEWKYFCTKLRSRIWVFLRATQGSRGGPLLWARTKAFTARLGQAVVPVKKCRINVYVDDPVIVVIGAKPTRERFVAKILLVWLAVGLAMSWHKAQRGHSVTWTSAQLDVSLKRIIVKIKPELLEALQNDAVEFLKGNVISAKRLRTFVGRAVHVSSLIMFWIPFVAQLWAPLSESARSSDAPAGCVWVKQVKHALLWILAFIENQRGTVARTYTVEAFVGNEFDTQIVVDASPWGIGAILVLHGRPVSYFGDALTENDEGQLQIKRGESAAQQAVEALCVLVALRAWSPHWQSSRSALAVRSDSVTALTMLLFCRATGSVARVAREVALDLAEGVYRPRVATHIPGALNVAADALSRLHDPSGGYSVPQYLMTVARVRPPPRGASFYRCAYEPSTAAEPTQ